MKNLFKKIKWFVKVAVVLGLLSVSSIQMLQVVLADDSSEKEPVIRTDGAQRINTNHLVWTPVSEANPLGGADDFNAILFDSFVNFNETGGPVAAGRFENVKIVTFEENLIGGINQFDDYAIPRFNVGMIAQNGVTGTKTKIHNGDVVISEQQYGEQTERSSGNSYVRREAINTFMRDAKDDLMNLQEQLWELSPTGNSSTNEGNQMTFTADQKMNIIELNQHERSSLHIDNIAPDGTIIMKVNTNQLNLNTIFINGVQINQQNINQIANRLLWVFDPAITDVRFHQTNLIGSVLAPTANIRFVDGYSTINGTLIANHLSGEGSSSELHYVGRYLGKRPNPIPPTEPEQSETDPSVESTTEPSDSDSSGESTTEPSVSDSGGESTTEPSVSDSGGESTTEPSGSDSGGESTTEPSVSDPSEESTSGSSEPKPIDESTSDSGSTDPTKDSTSNASSTDLSSDSTTDSSTSESSSKPGTSSSTSDSTLPLETSEDRNRPGRLPQTGGTANKKPVVGNNQNKQPTTPKQPNKANRYRTLPQTGEGESVIESLLSLVGLGTIFATGFIYVNLYRKK